MEISYAGTRRCRTIQNPKSEIQNPNSKIQTAPFGAATKRTKTKPIQKPKSKIQTPRSKIQIKIQDPKSKIQTPKSKIQTARLDFGFWISGGRAGAGGDGYVANDVVWPVRPPEICRRPPPEAKKRLFLEECSMCIKHRKYRQKWPLGRVHLGQGAGAQKS